MTSGIFRSYDIRGRYPKEINKEVVATIAQRLTRLFKVGRSQKRTLVLGRDGRLSSPELYRVLIKTLGPDFRLVEAGLVTTPMFYFLINFLKADGGVMVTSSHNDKNWNGLKIAGRGARPISGIKILNLVKDELPKKI